MVTAVDTNVFLDVFLNDPQYRSATFAALTKAFASGDVIVGEVVWSETGAAFPDSQSFLSAMDRSRRSDLSVYCDLTLKNT